MRVFLLVGVLVLSGCSTFVSLEELEDQAMITGDWSAVEEREKIIAKRKARLGTQCPNGMVNLCESRFGTVDCQCVNNNQVASLLGPR